MPLFAVLPCERAHVPQTVTLDPHFTNKSPPWSNKNSTPSSSQSGSPVIDHIMNLPATPPRTRSTGPILPTTTTVQGTPHNRGSASRSRRDDSNGITAEPQRVRRDYDDYIREDLSKHRVYISFEDGLKTLLNVPDNWRSSRHEYTRIISKIRVDTEYGELRQKYLSQCSQNGAIEDLLYKPQAALYNHVISLVNVFCNAPNRKDDDTLLHFQQNHPKFMAQGIFTGLNPDITAQVKPLKDQDHLVWPMIVHIEEMKDSDVALDRGHDAPRVRNSDGDDPKCEHRKPCRRNAKNTTTQSVSSTNKKRKNESTEATSNKVPRTSSTPIPSMSSATQSTIALNETQKTAGARLQCARYLMEMLDLSILRSHAFLTLVDRDLLQLMYADHSAIVTTSIIDLTTPEGETMFLAMLIAFHRLTPKQWGFLNLVENSFAFHDDGHATYHRDEGTTDTKYECLRDLTLQLQKKIGKRAVRLKLQDILYHQPGIIGRGTCVVGASCTDVKEWKKMDLVVKVSWPSESRMSEISLLTRAREKAEELLGKRQAQLATINDEIKRLQERGKFDEAAAKSKETKDLVEKSGTHWALNHLPNILHSEDTRFDSEPMPQTKLATFLLNATFSNGTFVYEPRVLRVSIQEKLCKLDTLQTRSGYAQAFYDIFICHRWLFDCPRILHRDISSGNMMYRIIDGVVHGVLNDFDLSSLRDHVDQGVQTSFQRTGTPPYMAIELLRDVRGDKHLIRPLYRHDLESFAYVILIICSRNQFVPGTGTSSIQRLTKCSFDKWFDPHLSWHDLALNKRDYLLGELPLTEDVHPTFHDFVPWLRALLSAFKKGFRAKEVWHEAMEEFKTYLNEGPSAEDEDSDSDLWQQTLRGAETTPLQVQEPPPFQEGTLGGQVNYLSILRSLRKFSGERLLYRDLDLRDFTTEDA